MRRPLAAATITIGLLTAAAPAHAADITGWMPYWAPNSTVANINAAAPGLIREVSPFWYELVADPDGTVTVQAHPLDTADHDAAAHLHAQGIALLPTVTDSTGTGVLSAYLAEPQHRISLATELLDIARAHDGIDLDLEGFAFRDPPSTWAATAPRWTAFVRALSWRLDREGLLLAVTTPPVTGARSGYWVYDWPGIARYVDRLRVMTYDYSYSSPGPISPRRWVHDIAAYATTVAPKRKIQIGAAAYGRNWVTGITGTCPAGTPVHTTVLTATDARAIANETGGTITWNRRAGEAVLTYHRVYRDPSTQCTVQRQAWYPTARSLRQHLAIADRHGLRSLAVWSLDLAPETFLAAPR